MHRRLIFAVVCVAVSLLAVAVQGNPASGQENPAVPEEVQKPCEKNSTAEGSFRQGKTVRTWQEFKGASYDNVFRAIAQSLVANEWIEVTGNKELGTITAGRGRINLVVKEKVDAIRVEAVAIFPGGKNWDVEYIKEELCKVFDLDLPKVPE